MQIGKIFRLSGKNGNILDFKENWPEDWVVMVNLSFGPLVNEIPVEDRLEATPEEVLHFVKGDYTQTRYGSQTDLEVI